MISTLSSPKLDASKCKTLFQVKVKLRKGQLPELKSVEMLTEGDAFIVEGPNKHTYLLPNQFDVFMEALDEKKCLPQWSRWLIDEAAKAIAGLPAGIGLAINVDPREIEQMGFLAYLDSRIQVSERSRIYLEITEQAQLDCSTGTNAIVRALSDAGYKISIDDFCKVPKKKLGHGVVDDVTHSHVHYLATLPVDELKIDMSCARLMIDTNTHPIENVVRWICDLPIHMPTVKVVMEGIESDFPQNFLKDYEDKDSVIFQGYAYSVKIPLHEVTARLRPGNVWQISPGL